METPAEKFKDELSNILAEGERHARYAEFMKYVRAYYDHSENEEGRNALSKVVRRLVPRLKVKKFCEYLLVYDSQETFPQVIAVLLGYDLVLARWEQTPKGYACCHVMHGEGYFDARMRGYAEQFTNQLKDWRLEFGHDKDEFDLSLYEHGIRWSNRKPEHRRFKDKRISDSYRERRRPTRNLG